MTVDEFKELKARLVARAREALDKLGDQVAGREGPIIFYKMPNSAVVSYGTQLFIKAPFKNYLTGNVALSKIYEERDGREVGVGLNHKELVSYYEFALEELDRALLLEDLANV